MKKILIVLVVVIAVIVGAWALFTGGPADDGAIQATDTPAVSSVVSGSPQSVVKVFTVTGKPFSFDPKEMKVNKGDTVKIVFTNTEGFHDWVIDEFNAHTPQIQAGKTAEVTFIADKTGSFQYYCSVGNHRAQGMWGTLTVQ